MSKDIEAVIAGLELVRAPAFVHGRKGFTAQDEPVVVEDLEAAARVIAPQLAKEFLDASIPPQPVGTFRSRRS